VTHLEKLIQAHVQAARVTTLSSATEKIAEDMAREILKDPIWREEMQALIRRHPLDTQTAAPPPAPPRRPTVAAMADDNADGLEWLYRTLRVANQETEATLARLRTLLDDARRT
jgi:hypothetical protein